MDNTTCQKNHVLRIVDTQQTNLTPFCHSVNLLQKLPNRSTWLFIHLSFLRDKMALNGKCWEEINADPPHVVCSGSGEVAYFAMPRASMTTRRFGARHSIISLRFSESLQGLIDCVFPTPSVSSGAETPLLFR